MFRIGRAAARIEAEVLKSPVFAAAFLRKDQENGRIGRDAADGSSQSKVAGSCKFAFVFGMDDRRAPVGGNCQRYLSFVHCGFFFFGVQ